MYRWYFAKSRSSLQVLLVSMLLSTEGTIPMRVSILNTVRLLTLLNNKLFSKRFSSYHFDLERVSKARGSTGWIPCHGKLSPSRHTCSALTIMPAFLHRFKGRDFATVVYVMAALGLLSKQLFFPVPYFSAKSWLKYRQTVQLAFHWLLPLRVLKTRVSILMYTCWGIHVCCVKFEK